MQNNTKQLTTATQDSTE